MKIRARASSFAREFPGWHWSRKAMAVVSLLYLILGTVGLVVFAVVAVVSYFSPESSALWSTSSGSETFALYLGVVFYFMAFFGALLVLVPGLLGLSFARRRESVLLVMGTVVAVIVGLVFWPAGDLLGDLLGLRALSASSPAEGLLRLVLDWSMLLLAVVYLVFGVLALANRQR